MSYPPLLTSWHVKMKNHLKLTGADHRSPTRNPYLLRPDPSYTKLKHVLAPRAKDYDTQYNSMLLLPPAHSNYHCFRVSVPRARKGFPQAKNHQKKPGVHLACGTSKVHAPNCSLRHSLRNFPPKAPNRPKANQKYRSSEWNQPEP